MTIKLYDENPYLKTTTAIVTACCEWPEKKFAISFDQTLFYPEGGGQPGDYGTLTYPIEPNQVSNLVAIEDTIVNTSGIWHIVSNPVAVGTLVQLNLDWERRFYHMQQHLGQHLLSASFFSKYEAKTIGFHMGADYVTIDLDLKLESHQIRHAETIANEQITQNLRVTTHYPDSDTLSQLPLRKVPKVDENIRIVSVNGFDHTPCGGTHPHFTGEVGLISIRKWSNYKGGTRIEFVCGGAAFKMLQTKTDLVNHLCQTLSVQEPLLNDRISKLLLEIDTLKRSVREKTDQCLSYEANDLVMHPEKTLSFLTQLHVSPCKHLMHAGVFDAPDFNALKTLSQQIQSQSPNSICLLVREIEDGYNILLEIPETFNPLSAKNILKNLQDQFDGKGGGSDRSAQSTFKAKDVFPKIIQALVDLLNTTINE